MAEELKICFVVPGEPQGKGRPKFSKRGSYVNVRTPDKTVLYENLIKTEFRSQCSNMMFKDNSILDMRVMAYYTIPKSTSNKKRKMMLDKKIRPSKTPDADNILKAVADSLNGIAYRDDAQIADVMLRKFYSEKPRIEIMIKNIEEEQK